MKTTKLIVNWIVLLTIFIWMPIWAFVVACASPVIALVLGYRKLCQIYGWNKQDFYKSKKAFLQGEYWFWET